MSCVPNIDYLPKKEAASVEDWLIGIEGCVCWGGGGGGWRNDVGGYSELLQIHHRYCIEAGKRIGDRLLYIVGIKGVFDFH